MNASVWGFLSITRSAITRPAPQATVQPSVPWPVASSRPCTGVVPTIGGARKPPALNDGKWPGL
jgi:hypothetical protein